MLFFLAHNLLPLWIRSANNSKRLDEVFILYLLTEEKKIDLVDGFYSSRSVKFVCINNPICNINPLIFNPFKHTGLLISWENLKN